MMQNILLFQVELRQVEDKLVEAQYPKEIKKIWLKLVRVLMYFKEKSKNLYKNLIKILKIHKK